MDYYSVSLVSQKSKAFKRSLETVLPPVTEHVVSNLSDEKNHWVRGRGGGGVFAQHKDSSPIQKPRYILLYT